MNLFNSKPETQTISLALQGGGAHGAFTWGVLDALLEDGRFDIEGISGTSAGAMNAICVAQGLMEGGKEGARKTLAKFWGAVAETAFLSTGLMPPERASAAMKVMLQWTKHLTPAQLNPMDVNPMRGILESHFDFEALRQHSPVKLFIAATHANSGKVRLFKNEEISVDALLASSCIPQMNRTVIIDGEPYWDGGFSANPAIFPLFWECDAADLLIVLLTPLQFHETPNTAKEIQIRLVEIAFNSTFLREMRMFAHMSKELSQISLPTWKFERRLRKVNFHAIHADDALEGLPAESKLAVNLVFFEKLRDSGRRHAEQWLREKAADVGERSSLDLEKLYY